MTPQNQQRRRRLRIGLRTAVVALAFALASLVFSSFRYNAEAREANAEMTRQVELNAHIRSLQTILIMLVDAETGQRGFLLTGKRSYLEPYLKVEAALPGFIRRLEHTPVASEAFRSHLESVERLAQLKLAELAKTISLREAGKADEALALVNTDAGQVYMKQARVELQAAMEIIRRDRDATTTHMMAAIEQRQRTTLVSTAMIIVTVLLTGALAILVTSSQRQYARDLAESERRHRVMVEEQQELISLAKEDGTLTYVNPAYSRTFDMAPALLLGRNIFEFVPSAEQALVKKQLGDVFRSGEPASVENRVTLPDGQERWFSWTNSVQQGTGGERLLHSVGRDVTRRIEAEAALKRSEGALRELNDILEHSSDLIVQTDLQGFVQYSNPATRRALGYAPEVPPGAFKFSELVTPETASRMKAEIMPAVIAKGVWVGETAIADVNARIVPVSHMVVAHIDSDGMPARFSSVMRDISQAVEARKALQQQSATLAGILEAIPASVAVFDDQFRFRLVNGGFERASDQAREQVLGRTVAEVFGAFEHERSWAWAQRALAGETVNYEKDYPERRQRHMSFTYVPLREADGSVTGIVSLVQDVTLQRDEEKRLLNLAERDVLTGVLNRTGFNHYIQARFERGEGTSIALLYVDLDKFKPVNDTYGHPVGDELLRLFAERLQSLVRPTDAVARLGGDEFAVVLNDVRSLEHASIVAEKVVEAAHRPFAVNGLQIEVGASVGVAHGEVDTGWNGLIERADAAVYRAKAAGRGRWA